MPQSQPSNAWSGMGLGWTIVATLIGGILVWGGIGFLVDRFVGTENVFTALGFVLGAAGGIYVVYLRFGRGDGADG